MYGKNNLCFVAVILINTCNMTIPFMGVFHSLKLKNALKDRN